MPILDITEKLLSFDKVNQVLVLDAGQSVLLVQATSGQWSTYTPSKRFTPVTIAEALIVADSYWHKTTFLAMLDKAL